MAKISTHAQPVRIRVAALSTSNLTLSGAQTIDSVACVAGDLVGALGQSNSKNGVYMVQSGAWLVVDPGFGTGLEVYATAGGSNANRVYSCETTGAINWGTTSTAFALKEAAGAPFDPASPGNIGETVPGIVNATSVSLPSITAPSATPSVLKVSAGSGTTLTRTSGTGDKYIEAYETATGTGVIKKRIWGLSLADEASLDITLTGSSLGGWGRAAAVGPTGSVAGLFSFAANAATSLNGATYTTFVATDTDTNLCVFANSGALRVRNRLGSTQTVMVEICELVAV